jgi:hypothetical protein
MWDTRLTWNDILPHNHCVHTELVINIALM